MKLERLNAWRIMKHTRLSNRINKQLNLFNSILHTMPNFEQFWHIWKDWKRKVSFLRKLTNIFPPQTGAKFSGEEKEIGRKIKCLISVKLIARSVSFLKLSHTKTRKKEKNFLSCRYMQLENGIFFAATKSMRHVSTIFHSKQNQWNAFRLLIYSSYLPEINQKNLFSPLFSFSNKNNRLKLRQFKWYSKFIRLNISLHFSDWFLIMSLLIHLQRGQGWNGKRDSSDPIDKSGNCTPAKVEST